MGSEYARLLVDSSGIASTSLFCRPIRTVYADYWMRGVWHNFGDRLLHMSVMEPSSMTTLNETVERLRGLMSKATPGPWESLVTDSNELLLAMYNDAAKVEDRVAGLIFSGGVPGAFGHGVTIATMNARRKTLDMDEASAALIVEAINSLPALLAERDRLRAALDEIESLLIPPGNVWTKDQPQWQSDAFMAARAALEQSDE